MRYIYLYTYLRREFTRVAPERPPVGADQELLVVEYEPLGLTLKPVCMYVCMA